jgi:carboxylesterase
VRIMPGAEPFEYPGSRGVGVLLVHGYTGSPAEMRPLAEQLARHEIGSIGILLRGHGTHPNEMLQYRYTDWIDDAEAGLDRLLNRYDRAFIVGLSMGGTLALNLAARHATDPRIAGVIPMCAVLRLVDWRLGLAPILSRLIRWQAWGHPNIKNVSMWDQHVAYRRFRTRTVLQLLALMRETQELLGQVRQPLLIVQASEDRVVPPWNAKLVHDLTASNDKRLLWLDNCYHVVTVDFDADFLCSEVRRFVEERSAPAADRIDDRSPVLR